MLKWLRDAMNRGGPGVVGPLALWPYDQFPYLLSGEEWLRCAQVICPGGTVFGRTGL